MVFLGFDEPNRLEIELKNIKRNLTNLDSRKKWDLIERVSGKVIGNCGFHNWLPEHQRAEIGYFLSAGFRSKGFMLEALKQVIDHGFNTMNLFRIEAFISPDNKPSINLIRKLGFSYEGLLRSHYHFNGKIHDSAIYSLLKSDLD